MAKRMSTLCIPLMSFGLAAAGCDSCPASMPVTLGDGTTVVATINTGPASYAGSKWAFFGSALPAPVTFLNTILPQAGALLFRIEYGPQGQPLRLYDNQVVGPAEFGPQILLDNVVRPMVIPSLEQASAGYAAENGSASGVSTCSIIHSEPFSIVKVSVSFSGTEDLLLGRTSGTLRFVTEVNPMFASLVPPHVKSETVEVLGYAVREN